MDFIDEQKNDGYDLGLHFEACEKVLCSGRLINKAY